MVAEAKDQTTDSLLVGSQMESVATQSKTLSINEVGYMPKVRKPYTITKQRERWAEDEHQRFVEALKLYGRAWRQIEEHVGTKTAIQIRSHAQKFFAKVTRDSSIDADGSLNPMEIPPPRPKKKPLRPYPRKFIGPAGTENNSHPLVKSQSPRVSVAEGETPTSVLSAIGSDTLESTVTEMHKSRLSPASCATEAHSAHFLSTENNTEYIMSNISAEGGDGFHLSMKISSASDPNNTPTMKLELFPGDKECMMGSPDAGELYSSIKLFGKTVMVKETPKESVEEKENPESFPSHVIDDKSEVNDNKPFLEPKPNRLQVFVGLFPHDVTSCCVLQNSSNNVYCPVENMCALPWCSWYQGIVNPNNSACKQTRPENSEDYPLKEVLKEEDLEREGSSVGSNSGSSSGINTDRNNHVVESNRLPSCRKGERGKGFVPYKRCFTERDDKLSVSLLPEREGQRARVCS